MIWLIFNHAVHIYSLTIAKSGWASLNLYLEKIIMPRKTHHVVPDGNNGWNLKKGGGERAIKHFENKAEAVKFSREVSKNQKSELVIHKKDGTIQNSDSHGNDPMPPRDKK